MTEKLYYKDSHMKTFQARVLSCQPCQDRYEVVLDATAFFPEGGGQAADTGMLDHARVLDVHEKQGVILHLTDAPLLPGAAVNGTLDWEKRFDRMQQHSGEHIVSGLVHRRLGFDNVGFHLGDAETTLDFNGVISREELDEIEWEANQAITANIYTDVSFPTPEELQNLDYRSKIEIQGQVRIVAYPGFDRCACCAPHVKQTGEIGLIRIAHVQSHRGGVRVNILCGMRALKDYREKAAGVKAVSVLLSANEGAIGEAVSRLKDEQYRTNGRLRELQTRILRDELKKLPPESRNVFFFFDTLDTEILREFVNGLMERCGGFCAAFTGNDQEGYRYIIGSSQLDVRPLGKRLNESCGGRGGGKPEMIQGSLCKDRAAVEAVLRQEP